MDSKILIEINKLSEQEMYNILRNIATSGEIGKNILLSCINHEKSKRQ
jgi:hypothetical protein